MDNSIAFKDRELLYGALVKDLKLQKVDEVYYPESFGNYSITFSAREFLIRYTSDRGQLFIFISSNYAPSKWYYLSVIKNFINNADKINVADENNFSLKSIILLNDFLKNDFYKIAELLNEHHYKITLKQIDDLLLQEFKITFPGAIKE